MIVAVLEKVLTRIKPADPSMGEWSCSDEFDERGSTWFIDLDKLDPQDPYRLNIEAAVEFEKRAGSGNAVCHGFVLEEQSATMWRGAPHSGRYPGQHPGIVWDFPMLVEAWVCVHIEKEPWPEGEAIEDCVMYSLNSNDECPPDKQMAFADRLVYLVKKTPTVENGDEAVAAAIEFFERDVAIHFAKRMMAEAPETISAESVAEFAEKFGTGHLAS